MIKLADFELSRKLDEVSNSNKDAFEILPYVDPQCFKKQSNNKNYKPNKKSDVYSVGVLLWEISSGQKPFESYNTRYTLIWNILNGERETPIFGTPVDFINIYTSMNFVVISFNNIFFFLIVNINIFSK
jgi:serine/threonine protein kinase